MQKGISTLVSIIIIIVIAVLAVGGGTYYLWLKKTQEPVACTQEAKICPDGSSVGRTGPNCEFAVCPDETAGWETYRNDKYGFEIKYPLNWVISSGDKTAQAVVLSNSIGGKNYSFIIRISENKDNLSSKQLAEKEKKNSETIKELTIADTLVYERYDVFNGDEADEIIYLAKDKYLYLFQFPISEENPNLANPLENNKIVHKMLSTFLFVHPNETAGWKNYTNDEYGFEIKYPNNWFIQEGLPGELLEGMPGVEQNIEIIALSPISFQEVNHYEALTEGKDIFSLEFSQYFDRERNVIKIKIGNVPPKETCKSDPPETQRINVGDIVGCREEGYFNWTVIDVRLPLPDKKLSLLIHTIGSNNYLDVFDKIISTFKFTPVK